MNTLTENDLVELSKTAEESRQEVQKLYPGLQFAPCIFGTKVTTDNKIDWD